jgi:hypothetical protein
VEQQSDAVDAAFEAIPAQIPNSQDACGWFAEGAGVGFGGYPAWGYRRVRRESESILRGDLMSVTHLSFSLQSIIGAVKLESTLATLFVAFVRVECRSKPKDILLTSGNRSI